MWTASTRPGSDAGGVSSPSPTPHRQGELAGEASPGEDTARLGFKLAARAQRSTAEALEGISAGEAHRSGEARRRAARAAPASLRYAQSCPKARAFYGFRFLRLRVARWWPWSGAPATRAAGKGPTAAAGGGARAEGLRRDAVPKRGLA